MGEPRHDLEARLEGLVPRGLSDEGRARLDQQIEELAGAVKELPERSGRWRWGLGVAAAVVAMAGVMLLEDGLQGTESGAGVEARPAPGADRTASERIPEDESVYETMDFARTIGEGEDGGILLDRFDEPRRAWNYPVREMELLLDKESGLQVRIVQDRREQVQVAVTSF